MLNLAKIERGEAVEIAKPIWYKDTLVFFEFRGAWFGIAPADPAHFEGLANSPKDVMPILHVKEGRTDLIAESDGKGGYKAAEIEQSQSQVITPERGTGRNREGSMHSSYSGPGSAPRSSHGRQSSGASTGGVQNMQSNYIGPPPPGY